MRLADRIIATAGTELDAAYCGALASLGADIVPPPSKEHYREIARKLRGIARDCHFAASRGRGIAVGIEV